MEKETDRPTMEQYIEHVKMGYDLYIKSCKKAGIEPLPLYELVKRIKENYSKI